jgi:hypothetical protein
MAVVLVSLPGGAGAVRGADGSTVVTDDVFEGGGSCLRGEDPYHLVKSWVDEDRSVMPLCADHPRVPVTDTDQPCPACGAIDYEE